MSDQFSDPRQPSGPSRYLPQATSFEKLREGYVPTEIVVTKVSMDEASLVLGELLIDEDGQYYVQPATLSALLNQCTTDGPLDYALLAEFIPQDSSVQVRKMLCLSVAQNSLNEQRWLEIEEVSRNPVDGPILALVPTDSPSQVTLKIRLAANLGRQTESATQDLWDFTERVFQAAENFSLERQLLSRVSEFPSTFSTGRMSLTVVDRTTLPIEPTINPHLSLDPHLIKPCAIRELDPSLQEQSLQERIAALQFKVAQLTNAYVVDFEKRALLQFECTRAELETYGQSPVLEHGKSLDLLYVDGYLLLVTTASTGDTLLADLAALEEFEYEYRHPLVTSQLPPWKRIDLLEPTNEQIHLIGSALSAPIDRRVVETVTDFTRGATELDYQALKNTLSEALSSDKALTVTLAEEYEIYQTYVWNDAGPPDSFEEDEDFEQLEASIDLSRYATITAPQRNPLSPVPHISIECDEYLDSGTPDSEPYRQNEYENKSLTAHVYYEQPIVKSSDAPIIPYPVAKRIIQSTDAASLNPTEIRIDQTSRIAILSPSVRVQF